MFATSIRLFSSQKSKPLSIFQSLKSITPQQLALKLTKQRNELHEHDENGYTALHMAAKLGRDDLIPTLIENGANIEAKDHLGQTPLKIAISSFSYPSIHALHQYGASPKACGILSGEEELALQFGQWLNCHGKTYQKENLTNAVLTSKKPFNEIENLIQNGTYSQDEVLATLKICLKHNKYSATQFLLKNLSKDLLHSEKNALLNLALQYGTQKGLTALFEAGVLLKPDQMRTDRDHILTSCALSNLRQNVFLSQFSRLEIKDEAESEPHSDATDQHTKINKPF